MRTVLIRKKGKPGGVLGFKKIVILDSFIQETSTGKEKQYRTQFLVELDGKLEVVSADDLTDKLEDYELVG